MGPPPAPSSGPCWWAAWSRATSPGPSARPALAITSDAALLFYGASMLLAALRGYAGCEVLAISNWLLGRDDQVGCLFFWPIDHAERRRTNAGMSANH